MKAQQHKKTLGRPPKRENQRGRILAAAAELIATRGYEGCALDDIAQSLDLTRPALYHYFSTKQEIITEITLTIVREMVAHVRASVDDDDPAELQLKSQMRAHAEYFDSNYWMMVAGTMGYGGIARRELIRKDEIQQYRSEYEKLLSGIIRHGIRTGEFRRVDVKATTLAVYQLLNITYWYRPGGSGTAVDFAMKNYELVRRGIERRKGD